MTRKPVHRHPLGGGLSKENSAASGTAAPVAASSSQRINIPLEFPGLGPVVCVTGSASNAGKTWLAEKIVAALRGSGRPVSALKVTRTHVDTCPRENEACGVCDDLTLPYRIISHEEILRQRGKDTSRYLAAGALQVLWLLVQPEHMAAGIRAVLPAVQPGTTLVAEGNSFRDYTLGARASLMMLSATLGCKPSAAHIQERTDLFLARAEEVEQLAQAPLFEVQERRPLLPAGKAAAWVVKRLFPPGGQA